MNSIKILFFVFCTAVLALPVDRFSRSGTSPTPAIKIVATVLDAGSDTPSTLDNGPSALDFYCYDTGLLIPRELLTFYLRQAFCSRPYWIKSGTTLNLRATIPGYQYADSYILDVSMTPKGGDWVVEYYMCISALRQIENKCAGEGYWFQGGFETFKGYPGLPSDGLRVKFDPNSS